jgi:hypothetical protein
MTSASFDGPPRTIRALATRSTWIRGRSRAAACSTGRCFEFEGVRNQALIKVMHAQPPGSLIYGGNSNDAAGYGGPCEGDSGSPVFRDGEIIGLYTNSLRHCTNWGAGPSSRRWPGTGLPPLARSGALILRAASIVRA